MRAVAINILTLAFVCNVIWQAVCAVERRRFRNGMREAIEALEHVRALLPEGGQVCRRAVLHKILDLKGKMHRGHVA
jgi:hypothetical protein